MKFEDFLKTKSIDSLEGKTAEEIAGLYNEYNAMARKAIDEKINQKAEQSEIDSLKKELDVMKNTQIEVLNKALKEQGVAIEKLRNSENSKDKPVDFNTALKEGLIANKENLEALKGEGDLKGARSGEFSMVVKVAGTMTFANVSGGNIPVEDRLEGLNIVPSRRIRLLDVLSARSTSSNVVSWVEQANKDGAAGTTGEGLAKNQIDFDLVVNSESIKKLTAFVKVSTEMLDDIDWIQSVITEELMRELLKAVETQAYSGDGTGNNLNGVRTQATAFAAGSFALAIDNANEVDVLAVAMNQIEVAQEGDTATFIFMHPTDVTAMKFVKLSSTDKRYVERVMMAGQTLMVDGIPIIKTTLVTQGQYLIGNFSKAMLVTKEGIRFEVGLDADDFTKNLRTIIAEWRGAVIVKGNDTTAFVKGVFATDKAALETP